MTPILRRFAKCSKIALPALALILHPSAVKAQVWLPISTSFGAKMFVLLSSNSHCVAYSYDQNGNRVLVTSAPVGSSSVLWGSGSYGCFVWGQ